MRIDAPWRCEPGLRLLHLSLAAAGPTHGATPTALSDKVLEARFWGCDVASTDTLVSAAEGMQCVRWQDELRQRRLEGDFGHLLAWWQPNKPEQHARHRLALKQRGPPH